MVVQHVRKALVLVDPIRHDIDEARSTTDGQQIFIGPASTAARLETLHTCSSLSVQMGRYTSGPITHAANENLPRSLILLALARHRCCVKRMLLYVIPGKRLDDIACDDPSVRRKVHVFVLAYAIDRSMNMTNTTPLS
nr:hypothetical protein CFP56_09460 [Quercus suber]